MFFFCILGVISPLRDTLYHSKSTGAAKFQATKTYLDILDSQDGHYVITILIGNFIQCAPLRNFSAISNIDKTKAFQNSQSSVKNIYKFAFPNKNYIFSIHFGLENVFFSIKIKW